MKAILIDGKTLREIAAEENVALHRVMYAYKKLGKDMKAVLDFVRVKRGKSVYGKRSPALADYGPERIKPGFYIFEMPQIRMRSFGSRDRDSFDHTEERWLW